MKKFLWLLIVPLLLAGCNAAAPAVATDAPALSATDEHMDHTGIGMRMGMGGGMMERHHATIPEEYIRLNSPVATDEASIARGGELFAVNCASCHGDGGMGDGIASVGLDPAPAPLAHTSLKMGDNYLFWRISEGGKQFNSAMPAWKEVLDEQARWDLINYVRALGAGDAAPVSAIGGEQYDPAAQAAHQAEMLAQAVAQGVITDEEAEIFTLVHDAIENYFLAHPDMRQTTLTTDERLANILAELVKAQTILQAQADAFPDIHDRLHAAGLME